MSNSGVVVSILNLSPAMVSTNSIICKDNDYFYITDNELKSLGSNIDRIFIEPESSYFVRLLMSGIEYDVLLDKNNIKLMIVYKSFTGNWNLTLRLNENIKLLHPNIDYNFKWFKDVPNHYSYKALLPKLYLLKLADRGRNIDEINKILSCTYIVVEDNDSLVEGYCVVSLYDYLKAG